MIQILLIVLIALLVVLVIPLIVLVIYLFPFLKKHDGEIAALRKIIFILTVAKIIFVALILRADFYILTGTSPVSIPILLILIAAIIILASANWYALFKIVKILHR